MQKIKSETRASLKDYYDNRYSNGYMEKAWDTEKLRRVAEMLALIPLSDSQRILDFGCGDGVFSSVLKRVFPNCRVVGYDISDVAVAKATEAHPDCCFSSNLEDIGTFDLIFSHHVLEHVECLDQTISLLRGLCNPMAYQFHILPCGNEGSFEYKLAKKKENGLFHFEDPTHLRRLTSAELDKEMEAAGFLPVVSRFACQYWGALDWITKTSPRFILFRMKAPLWLTFLTLLRFVTKYSYFERKAAAEWELSKSKSNGSEMYIVYKKASNVNS